MSLNGDSESGPQVWQIPDPAKYRGFAASADLAWRLENYGAEPERAPS